VLMWSLRVTEGYRVLFKGEPYSISGRRGKVPRIRGSAGGIPCVAPAAREQAAAHLLPAMTGEILARGDALRRHPGREMDAGHDAAGAQEKEGMGLKLHVAVPADERPGRPGQRNAVDGAIGDGHRLDDERRGLRARDLAIADLGGGKEGALEGAHAGAVGAGAFREQHQAVPGLEAVGDGPALAA